MSRFSLGACHKHVLFGCILAGLLVLLAGCGVNAGAFQTGGVPAQRCSIEVSWAKGYHSLAELKHAPELDLAVQGKITAVTATTDHEPDVSTDFTFTITSVLLAAHQHPKGLVSRDGEPAQTSSLTIHQGGSEGCQVSDDPLFQIGDEAILFLHQFSPGHYYVIGGPSGRFVVRDGLVQPINDEGVKLSSSTTEEQFDAMVQQA